MHYTRRIHQDRKNVWIPGIVGTNSLYQLNWNSCLPKGSLINFFHHKAARKPKEARFSWGKKYCIKGKIDSLWTSRYISRTVKLSTEQFHKNFFLISKCLACNSEKSLQLKIQKKNECS